MDESWKDSVRKEQETDPRSPHQEAAEVPEADFLSFVSTLAMQALVFLGEVPHPATGKQEADLGQAKYLIDTLQMLADKTKGNLTEQEANEMNTLLYELRVRFVRKSQPAGPA